VCVCGVCIYTYIHVHVTHTIVCFRLRPCLGCSVAHRPISRAKQRMEITGRFRTTSGVLLSGGSDRLDDSYELSKAHPKMNFVEHPG